MTSNWARSPKNPTFRDLKSPLLYDPGNLRNPRPEIGPQCQVSGKMSGKMRYSLQTWPRRTARAGGPPRVPGGPAGGPRPRVRPQPPAASPPQVVWESSDAETLTYLSLRHSALGVHLQNVGKIPRFRPAGPDRGRFGGTERQSGRFLCVAPLLHHLGG